MKKSASQVPTIREVAKLARVGLMTVSRVINNHPSVRPATRKKVEAAIAQLGYQQNEAARLLKGQRAKLIGLIVPDLSDIFFASCADTVQHIARKHGYMTLVVSSERDPDLELEQAELMAKRMISGLLMVSSIVEDSERLTRLIESDLPIVAFDRPLPQLASDAVLVENRQGAENAVQHLLKHGHQRIACVGYDQAIYTVRERIEGYKHAMQDAHLRPQVSGEILSPDDVREWVASNLRGKDAPSAVFSLNHRTSVFLLQAMSELNIKVPDQVAIIGFDDFELASIVQPPLTTVAQSSVDLTRRAMHLLLERIQNGRQSSVHEPAKILLPTRLVIRRSCGTHPSGA